MFLKYVRARVTGGETISIDGCYLDCFPKKITNLAVRTLSSFTRVMKTGLRINMSTILLIKQQNTA